MQSLVRSKTMGVTGNGGRGTAGAGPGRNLLYGSRGLPAPYRRNGDLGPHEPCPRTPRVQIVESLESTPDLEAREERRCSGRRALVGHGLDMDDLASFCERQFRKACTLRSAAEELEETGSNGRARRYRKRGSPKPAAEARAMETDPSPVRLWSAADSERHSDGYRTAFPSESEEMAIAPTRAHTAPEPSLEHDAEAFERPTRARTAPVARHTEPMRDNMGDTPMAEESEAPGNVGCAGSGGKHVECHSEHVSFLISKYPKMGMDTIVQHLDHLDNQKDGLEEDIARILDDQSEAKRDMAQLRAEQDRYWEKLQMALQKQPRVVDSLLHLVEDMSGRLKRLEELQALASGPELPVRPATAELVQRVKILRSAMEKPMGGPAEAPYAPARVDPGALQFVPMFSESIMLGEHTAPAGSLREEHATTDLGSLTVQMSHAAQDPPTAMIAHAVYAGRGDPDHAGANHGKGRRTWSRPSRRRPVGEGPHYGDMDGRWSKSFPHPKPHGFRPNWTALHGGEGCTGSVLTTPGHRWYPSRWSGGCGRWRRHQDLRPQGNQNSPPTMATPPTWMTSSWIGRTSPRRSSAR